MADLLCHESIGGGDRERILSAEMDPVFFHDQRVLDNLLQAQAQYAPKCDYFEEFQPDLKPFMRNVVTTWMMEVCEELRMEPQVFSTAVSLLDRFLCERRVDKTQLQMIACACLLVASKVRQCAPVSVQRLVYYTDYSVSADQLRNCEVVVLSVLGWDSTSVTGFDLVDHVFERTPWTHYPAVRRHARTLVDLCYCEPLVFRLSPATIAAGCLVAAARGMHVAPQDESLQAVCSLARCDPRQVESLVPVVESLVANLLPAPERPPPAAAPHKPLAASEELGQPETPTDVQDIFF